MEAVVREFSWFCWNGLGGAMLSISGTFLGQIISILTTDYSEMPDGEKRKRLLKRLLLFTAVAGLIVFLGAVGTHYVYQTSAVLPRMVGMELSAVDELLRENGISGAKIHIEHEKSGKIVESQIPEAGRIVRRTEPVITLDMRASEEGTGETADGVRENDSAIDYFEAADLDAYVSYAFGAMGGITIAYPSDLFEIADPEPDNDTILNPTVQIFLKGKEENLEACFGYSVYDPGITEQEALRLFADAYKAEFKSWSPVSEDDDNVEIFSGYTDEEHIRNTYVLVKVEGGMVYTMRVVFPFEGVADESEFARMDLKQYESYEKYVSDTEEDYKIKSYLVDVMYHKCSFSQARSALKAYSEYELTWEVPRKPGANGV